LQTPRAYSAAQTDDLRAVIAHIKQTHPVSPLLAIGFSLGSMILVK
jgi:predicted alpha/beta-fold hydrolase